MGTKASCQLSEVSGIAKELKVSINCQEEGAEHTWTANDFATKWVQRMLFTVVKFCAIWLCWYAGLRKAVMAADRLVPQDLAIAKASGTGRTVSLRVLTLCER